MRVSANDRLEEYEAQGAGEGGQMDLDGRFQVLRMSGIASDTWTAPIHLQDAVKPVKDNL